jgi:hypothetical protein
MEVKFGFDVNSIEKAISEITAFRQRFKDVKTQFLQRCAEWVRDEANSKLNTSGIGDALKEEIKTKWEISITPFGSVRLVNHSKKSVFVEFGVGVVGQQSPHHYAGQAGYAYNIPSNAKRSDGSWDFEAEKGLEYLDIPLSDAKIKYPEGKLPVVITKGTKGVMYAYNALMDLRDFKAKQIWKSEFQ